MDASVRVMIKRHHFGTAMPSGGVHPINLGSHKSAELRRMIRAAGERLRYLPPYSPDLNPIEQAFAKIKHWMRRPADKRTVEDVWRESEPSSPLSSQLNATTTSTTPDTLPSKHETL